MRVHIFQGVLFFLLSASLSAEWNEEFEEKTNYLVSHFPKLQEETYLDSYQRFLLTKTNLLKNSSLKKKIKAIPMDEKEAFLDVSSEVVIKKRRQDNIHELFAWEVSCLFGVSEFFLPAFPLEISEKKVILQEKESFVHGTGKLNMLPKEVVKKVSLQTYWKAHLAAYLLGVVDLVAKNVGVGKKGKILFFDAEMSFSYHNKISAIKPGFSAGFLAESFDWPQYSKPLDHKTAIYLRQFVDSLANIEKSLRLYEELREVPILGEDLAYRLEKVRSFSFVEGQSFKDFFCFIYPKLGSGLDKLVYKVGEILEQKVGYGSALIFMTRKIDHHPLTSSQKKSIEKWIDTYID